MPVTILVVDDKANVRQLLQEYLTEKGFRVVTVDNGYNALYTARHDPPDLILLDIMMPKMDGYQFLEQYRKERQTPVIIITAKIEESDAVMGLNLGADDYIVKPFRMRELEARIRAVLRRSEEGALPKTLLHVGDISLDLGMHTATIRNQDVQLTPIEFKLLELLMRSPGRVFTRSQMIDHLIDSNFSGLDRTLNVHIRNLRKKIEIDPENPHYIETVFGVGYRLRKDLI
jgi:DNA-binding response OmpR family regulator